MPKNRIRAAAEYSAAARFACSLFCRVFCARVRARTCVCARRHALFCGKSTPHARAGIWFAGLFAGIWFARAFLRDLRLPACGRARGAFAFCCGGRALAFCGARLRPFAGARFAKTGRACRLRFSKCIRQRAAFHTKKIRRAASPAAYRPARIGRVRHRAI